MARNYNDLIYVPASRGFSQRQVDAVGGLWTGYALRRFTGVDERGPMPWGHARSKPRSTVAYTVRASCCTVTMAVNHHYHIICFVTAHNAQLACSTALRNVELAYG